MDTIWTPELVRERLKVEVSKVRNIRAPQYGPVLRAFDKKTGKLDLDVFSALKDVGHGDEDGGTQKRLMMLVWATQANQSATYTDASIQEICDLSGWKRATFDRKVNAGFEQLAHILNMTAARLREGEKLFA